MNFVTLKPWVTILASPAKPLRITSLILNSAKRDNCNYICVKDLICEAFYIRSETTKLIIWRQFKLQSKRNRKKNGIEAYSGGERGGNSAWRSKWAGCMLRSNTWQDCRTCKACYPSLHFFICFSKLRSWSRRRRRVLLSLVVFFWRKSSFSR